MASTTQSRRRLVEKERPSGIVSIRDILDEKFVLGRMVSVVGLVQDMRAPMRTRGSDWKCTLTIYDKSIEDDGTGLQVNVFRSEDKLPQADAGDVVVVSSAKISSWDGQMVLLTHKSTQISVFSASAIPKPPQSAADALRRNPSTGRPLTEKEHEYVSWLYHAIEKYRLPDAVEFQANKERSLNIKDKFRTLSNVCEGQFCDLVVQVVKDPWDQGDRITLWVTDYTEHESFFKFSWDGSDMPVGRDGDPYGYIAPNNAAMSRTWPGPFGKRSLQLTCYEPHASRLKNAAKAGDWVKLRNTHIKMGRNGHNLEGFLREDRNAYGSRNSFEILDISGAQGADDRLKDAIRRKRDYEKTAKQQKKAYAAKNHTKRKADHVDDTKQNSRTRRDARRVALNKERVQQETKKEAMLGLNQHVKCESIDQPIYPLAKILEPVSYHTNVDGEEVEIILPYTNLKYRATVRVVDYMPQRLEDFAVWRKASEFNMLSDYSGSSDSESDDDRRTLDRFAGEKIWEWRFALQLEEAGHKAGTKGRPQRLWVMVNDNEGQHLTDHDACDLRANRDHLASLREQMFKLWGNLEEHKKQELQAQIQSRQQIRNNQAPPDSSDNEDADGNAGNGKKSDSGDVSNKVSNKPFNCCLQQYGVEMPEPDPQKCDAGEGKRYERMFGLFGTAIH